MSLRKPLEKVLLFTALFAILHLGLSQAYTHLVAAHASVAAVDAEFRTLMDEINILILGDSHPRNDVHPKLITDQTFNLASQGENYIQTYYKLRTFVEEEHLDLDLVILTLDLHTLTSFRTDRFLDNFYWKRYINYVELGAFKGDLPTYLGYRLQGEFSYLGGLDETLEYLENYPVTQTTIYGFHPRDDEGVFGNKKTANQLGRAQRRANSHFEGHETLDADLVAYFLKILDLCKEHGIAVVLVRYPVTLEYYNAAAVHVSYPQMYSELESILENNGHRLPILDYHDMYWGQNDLFVDPSHLTLNGALAFTQVLAGDLERLEMIP